MGKRVTFHHIMRESRESQRRLRRLGEMSNCRRLLEVRVGRREDLLQLGATDSSGQLPHMHIPSWLLFWRVVTVILKREPRKQLMAPDAPCLGIVDLYKYVSPQMSPNVPVAATGVGPTPTWKQPRPAEDEL